MPPPPTNIQDRLGRDARESKNHEADTADEENPKERVGTPGLHHEQEAHKDARERREPDASPHSETTLDRYAPPLVPEGPPYRRIHRQSRGEGHKDRDQRGNASHNTHGFLLPHGVEAVAQTGRGDDSLCRGHNGTGRVTSRCPNFGDLAPKNRG
jgi:hypothetical protein